MSNCIEVYGVFWFYFPQKGAWPSLFAKYLYELSVVKTSTFSERNVTLTLLTCPRSSFCGCRLQRSPSILDQFQKLVVPVRHLDTKTWENKVQVEKYQSCPLRYSRNLSFSFLFIVQNNSRTSLSPAEAAISGLQPSVTISVTIKDINFMNLSHFIY